jgi:hypothetical protein
VNNHQCIVSWDHKQFVVPDGLEFILVINHMIRTVRTKVTEDGGIEFDSNHCFSQSSSLAFVAGMDFQYCLRRVLNDSGMIFFSHTDTYISTRFQTWLNVDIDRYLFDLYDRITNTWEEDVLGY